MTNSNRFPPSEKGISSFEKGRSKRPLVLPIPLPSFWLLEQLYGREPAIKPQYGSDGLIPAKYRSKVDNAFDLAYDLTKRTSFTEVFRDTVSKLAKKNLQPDVYRDSLNKMMINLAETSKNPLVQQELIADMAAVKADPSYKSPPGLSIRDGTQVWLREFLLVKVSKVIAGVLIHESAHLAGAPTDPLAEFAIDIIHNAAGYPRYIE